MSNETPVAQAAVVAADDAADSRIMKNLTIMIAGMAVLALCIGTAANSIA